MSEQVGTLNEQLAKISHFLSIPMRFRMRIGNEVVWEHVGRCIDVGLPVHVPDEDFRKLVKKMLDAQRELRKKDLGDDERREVLGRIRLLERDVLAELREGRWQ